MTTKIRIIQYLINLFNNDVRMDNDVLNFHEIVIKAEQYFYEQNKEPPLFEVSILLQLYINESEWNKFLKLDFYCEMVFYKNDKEKVRKIFINALTILHNKLKD